MVESEQQIVQSRGEAYSCVVWQLIEKKMRKFGGMVN